MRSDNSDQDGGQEAVELVPGLTAPAISGGSPVGAYICGDYRAVVSTDITSLGPIKYSHVLTVFRRESESPMMFVTSESSEFDAEILEALKGADIDGLELDSVSEIVLGLFDKDGHRNLGPMPEISSLDGFTKIALSIMRKQLQLVDEPRPS